MKLTYTNVNGYLISNRTYKSGEQIEQLGKYGFSSRDYLKNHRNSLYQIMFLQDSVGEFPEISPSFGSCWIKHLDMVIRRSDSFWTGDISAVRT